MAHGLHDEVLPVELAGRKVAADLSARGDEAELVQFDGGHVVTPDLVAQGVAGWPG